LSLKFGMGTYPLKIRRNFISEIWYRNYPLRNRRNFVSEIWNGYLPSKKWEESCR
jgi:hypothetical protein